VFGGIGSVLLSKLSANRSSCLNVPFKGCVADLSVEVGPFGQEDRLPEIQGTLSVQHILYGIPCLRVIINGSTVAEPRDGGAIGQAIQNRQLCPAQAGQQRKKNQQERFRIEIHTAYG